MDRSSHGVFVSKNQTKVNHPFDHRARTASRPLPQSCQLPRIIVFPFIIWFYGSAIAIIRDWGCGFGNSEHIVTWSDNRPSFTVLGFMAVVAYCRGI
jgi:hypothetical protein